MSLTEIAVCEACYDAQYLFKRGIISSTSIGIQPMFVTPYEDAKNAMETALKAVGYKADEMKFYVIDDNELYDFYEYLKRFEGDE